MADLAAERAWMRKMAVDAERRQQAESDRLRAEDEAWESEHAWIQHPQPTCPKCGHAWHAHHYGLVCCFDPSCLCGVAPCPNCGVQHRDWREPDPQHPGTTLCGRCGWTMTLGAIA